METAFHNSVGFLYTTDHKETVSDDSRAGAYRIVNTLDVPLKLSSKPNAEQAVSKEFSQGEARGSIQQTGVWKISAVVVHTGGGEFTNMTDIFEASTCVRVVTRCEGAC